MARIGYGETPGPPEIEFKSTVFDFGIAGPHQSIGHTFRFENIGESTLVIENIATDCGCTVASVTAKEIPAGEDGTIAAVLETRRFEGAQKKSIVVFTNDPDSPEIRLTMLGVIKRDVAVVPQGIHFGKVEKGERAVRRVKVLQLSPEPLMINKIESDSRYLDIRSDGFEDENQRGIRIHAALKSTVPIGTFSEVISLHTNSKRRPRVDIPVWATILGHIRISPDALNFGPVEKGAEFTREITLRSTGDKPFRVTGVSCDLPFIHLASLPAAEKKGVTIQGRIDKVSPAGTVSSIITIFTDDPDQRRIQLPIHGTIQK